MALDPETINAIAALITALTAAAQLLVRLRRRQSRKKR
jgi:hypothetical protein